MSVVLTGLLGIIHNYRPEMNVVRVSMRFCCLIQRNTVLHASKPRGGLLLCPI